MCITNVSTNDLPLINRSLGNLKSFFNCFFSFFFFLVFTKRDRQWIANAQMLSFCLFVWSILTIVRLNFLIKQEAANTCKTRLFLSKICECCFTECLIVLYLSRRHTVKQLDRSPNQPFHCGSISTVCQTKLWSGSIPSIFQHWPVQFWI